MTKPIFRSGGPLNMVRTSRDMYRGTLTIEPEEDGMVARSCSAERCTPGYFRIKMGTGIAVPQAMCFCPYCGIAAPPADFVTKAQVEYAEKLLFEEAKAGINSMLRDALQLDRTGKRTLGGGLLSITMKMEPMRPGSVSRPVEDELRRDLTCPRCGLVHAVFGLAFVCPDCGADIFLTHVHEELAVLKKILAAVPQRRGTLGGRVAARDVENSLEDLVSIFEGVMKTVTRRALVQQGKSIDDIDGAMRRVGNKFQNIDLGAGIYVALTGRVLFGALSTVDLNELREVFEKRHPITHNLGVVDRKYLERVTTNALEGQELRVTLEEIERAIDLAEKVVGDAYVQTAAVDPVRSESAPGNVGTRDDLDTGFVNGPLVGLSPLAVQVAESLLRQSEQGLDRDPTIELETLAVALDMDVEHCRAACVELERRGWIHDDCNLVGGGHRISVRSQIFQALDLVWFGHDVTSDAVHLVLHLRGGDSSRSLAVTAAGLGWSHRRMNPAIQLLSESGVVELGPYAHPYLANWIHENENMQAFLDAVQA